MYISIYYIPCVSCEALESQGKGKKREGGREGGREREKERERVKESSSVVMTADEERQRAGNVHG